MTGNTPALTPIRVLRGYFYVYLILNLALSLAIGTVFKSDHQYLCKQPYPTFELFRVLCYFVPSIKAKIIAYESFAEHPVDLCFLKFMYVAIILTSLSVALLSIIPFLNKFRTMETDKAIHIAIFVFISLGGIFFGSVNQTRIGLIELHYGNDGIFILIETFYYTLIGGLVADVMCNVTLGIAKILDGLRLS